MDDQLRELERRVLGGDALLLPALRRAYERAGPMDAPPKPKPGAGPVMVPIPQPHRRSRTPLYDKVTILPTASGGAVNSLAFTHFVGGLDPVTSEPKTIADTSSTTQNGLLPSQDSYFFWQAIAVVPDAGSRVSDVEAIWNDCILDFESSSSRTLRWPIRDLMRRPALMPQDEAGVLRLSETTPERRIVMIPGERRVMRPDGVRTIRGRFPLEIGGQDNARIHVSGVLRQPTEGLVRLMVILYGILLTPPAAIGGRSTARTASRH